MRCPDCGHLTDNHNEFGCNHHDPGKVCMCKLKGQVLVTAERETWKKEALFARRYIAVLERGISEETLSEVEEACYFYTVAVARWTGDKEAN